MYENFFTGFPAPIVKKAGKGGEIQGDLLRYSCNNHAQTVDSDSGSANFAVQLF